eukprot:jgi/Chlat1/1005/Chrsp109S08621
MASAMAATAGAGTGAGVVAWPGSASSGLVSPSCVLKRRPVVLAQHRGPVKAALGGLGCGLRLQPPLRLQTAALGFEQQRRRSRQSVTVCQANAARTEATGAGDDTDRRVLHGLRKVLGGAPLTAPADDDVMPTSKLAIYFGLWYAFNIVFNIMNKRALNVYPVPWLLATVQVAISFTHVIKSAEPVFSVLFSRLFMGTAFAAPVYLSLIPIVFGCSLASVTELSFNFPGFAGAMISNFGFVLRNIYSKKTMKNFKHIDGVNLYAWITIFSLLYLAPVAVIVEGAKWGPAWHVAAAKMGGASNLFQLILGGSLLYHLYNQMSYMALKGITPLTFSVGNTMKRVAVIIASVLWFRTPVKPLNALGSAIAVLGTFLYSQATSPSSKPVKAKIA